MKYFNLLLILIGIIIEFKLFVDIMAEIYIRGFGSLFEYNK